MCCQGSETSWHCFARLRQDLILHLQEPRPVSALTNKSLKERFDERSPTPHPFSHQKTSNPISFGRRAVSLAQVLRSFLPSSIQEQRGPS
ncbi:hypothetical protein CF326_g2994 [Tilletia indica]|uniref:Uncharacterized protein n=1 Tax=Tilletia indica TaxID=43049 RepID=A0A177T944_9BASI|nr:hypothetical protein CF326_g2994 [Tilletia indica]KAE8250913.1 hypothetical protein A4X13_0g4265 [Tilletia indica]